MLRVEQFEQQDFLQSKKTKKKKKKKKKITSVYLNAKKPKEERSYGVAFGHLNEGDKVPRRSLTVYSR
jgi:hypothetical protein